MTAPQKLPAEKSRILVVEDEQNVAEVLKARLESYGYEVCRIVSSGADALTAAAEMTPDVIMMDIKIQGPMDGIETAGLIRQSYEIPVIYLTAYSDDRLLQRAKATEPLAYILKPYDGAELRSAIEIALYRHKVEKERRQLIRDLQKALSEVKKLSGLLPICASCKKIRNDQGYWSQVEAYIEEHSEVVFTHSVCPECAKALYPGFKQKPVTEPGKKKVS
jgi:CheY-like chemotaxis protein